MGLVEFTNQPWSKDIPFICPRIFFIPKSLPFYKVLQLVAVESAIDDFFDLVMFLVVDYFGERRSLISTVEGIMRS